MQEEVGMSKWNIVGYTSYESHYPTAQITQEEFPQVVDLVVEEVKKNGYCFSGEDHQNHDRAVPVFENGTAFRCSMRLWAQIMALVHSGDKTKYMDYYMEVPSESVFPREETRVKPSEIANPYAYVAEEDAGLLVETVSAGIDTLMTTDKALLSLWPRFKTLFKA